MSDKRRNLYAEQKALTCEPGVPSEVLQIWLQNGGQYGPPSAPASEPIASTEAKTTSLRFPYKND